MRETAIALGTFDGLHKAHIAVLNNAVSSGFKPVCLTFTTSPKFVFSNTLGNKLLPLKQKNKTIKAMGFLVKTLEFNKIKNWSPKQFLEWLDKKYSPKVICCGYNFKFGKDAAGDCEYLKEFFKNKAKVIVCDEMQINGETVSSSKIRKFLKTGEIEKANLMLNYEFKFTAPVIKGDRRGRTIGFPTINQKYDSELVVLRFGAYVTKTIINNKEYDSITNIGVRPSFKTDGILVETHILNFNQKVYGKNATIKFVSFLRDETKFNTIEELKEQLEKDKLSLQRKEENHV